MVTPRLALRFREITPNVDTIREHEQILETQGAVWWGWWRKYFEPAHKALFARLAKEGGGHALLLDRETQRCFTVRYTRAAGAGSRGVDEERVPPYYRSQIGYIAGWLLLDEIKKTDYRPDIAEGFGQFTLLPLDAPARASKGTAKARGARRKRAAAGDGGTRPKKKAGTISMERPGILHLSDLHFGTDYSFLTQGERPQIGDTRKTLTHCLKEDLKRVGLLKSIGLILVTGDFMTGKDKWPTAARKQVLREFEALRVALGLSKEQVVAVPGNHDIERYKPEDEVDPNALAAEAQTRARHENEYRLFLQDLTGRSATEPLQYYLVYSHADFDLVVAALNSCTITATQWTEYGYVGDSGVSVLNEVGELPVERPTFRLVSLHHHVVPVNKVEAPNSAGVSLTLDAVDILDAGQRAGFHFLIHGHQHMPRVSRYGRVKSLSDGNAQVKELYIISGGSTGAVHSRLPTGERNTYTVLTLGTDGVRLFMRELRTDGKAGASLYDCPLDASPATQ